MVIPDVTREHWSVNIRKFVVAARRIADMVRLGSMSPEDIAKTGEGLSFLVSQLQRLADPDLQAKITKLIAMLGEIDTAKVKPTGVFGLMAALGSAEGKQTLGLLAEVIKVTGKSA